MTHYTRINKKLFMHFPIFLFLYFQLQIQIDYENAKTVTKIQL